MYVPEINSIMEKSHHAQGCDEVTAIHMLQPRQIDAIFLVLLFGANPVNRLHRRRDAREIDETTILLLECVDQLDLAILGEILAEFVLSDVGINVTEINVARRARLDGSEDRGGERRGFAPANFETTVLDQDALIGGLMNAASNDIANLFAGGIRMNISEIDRAVGGTGNGSGRDLKGLTLRCSERSKRTGKTDVMLLLVLHVR
ncbi:hypothetical protein BC938DRAFT_470973 [Jimgerdemannia flammicorona]|uniref:Uncharacterized protein n=1 Tax=Jimgerdemannia flammicorona TaxID=994334 RepID=A0A433QUW9_9FUNG|nr:hypothetical protein BC938DRAFT_470973 [Jimgerdemannia flammicorona]